MRPILFSENTTQFNTNGLGRLDCISCTVVEERNGEYTLEMEIAETALHASEIALSSIIAVKPSEGASLQAFRVYKITKPLGGKFTVYAQHISYQLSFIPTMPFTVTASASACSQTLTLLKSNAVETCPFTFTTDVQTVASYSQKVPASIRSRLGGVEGSVLDQFGGEYEWDNYTIRLHKNRGKTVPDVSLRYGKNITDLNQETNIENTITGIVPYWQSSDGDVTVTLPEKVIEGTYASSFPFKRTTPMDFSQDFEEQPTEAQLRLRAQHYVSASGIGVPAVSIKLSFIHLADTEEYKNLAAFQTVKLCDNVEVYFEKLGIATTAKIVRTEYDVLLERYNSVEIGSLRNTLSGVISSTEGALSQVANDTRRMFKNYNKDVEGLIDNATYWLTSADGYVMAVKNPDGSWKELLFLSTNDPNRIYTNANVLRVNQNGIGFSSTGINGPFTQAWTLDGKMVIGGTNVPSLTVYDNSGNILFQIDKNGMQWKAPNSELNTSGTLTIKNSSGNTLGTWSSSGLTMYDGNGNVIGSWGSGGIDVKKGSIEGTSLKVGTNNSTPGSIHVYNGNGATSSYEIGHWDKDGISVKQGTIEGPTIKVGGNSTHSGNGGSIYVYDDYGTEIGHWNKNGISVKEGTIQGPDIVAGGNNNADGTITVKDQAGGTAVELTKDGINALKGTISGANITGGTITGATIQSAASGSRILMDDTSSLRGYDGSTMHNLINMEQNVSGSHQMTIDADTQLNIRTPNLYVSNQSAGTGTETVYQTVTNNPTGASDSNPDYYLVKNLNKYAEAEDPEHPSWERWVKTISPEDADWDWDVLCTLPVYLKFDKTPLRYINGMLVSGGTSQSVII